MDTEERFLIEKFGKERPFKVPSGYFDELRDKIKTEVKENSDSKSSQFIKILKPYRHNRVWLRYVAAAAILGLVIVSAIAILGQKQSGTQMASNSSSAQEVQQPKSKEIADNQSIKSVSKNDKLALATVSVPTRMGNKSYISTINHTSSSLAVDSVPTQSVQAVTSSSSKDYPETSADKMNDDTDIEQAADYMMIDNDALYYLISEYE